jgi:virginiamycin B lyase
VLVGLICAALAAAPALASAAPSVTEYSVGLQANNASRVGGIVAGPDGNLWFTDDGAVPAIGKITPSGTITEYSTGLQKNNASKPVDVTVGADGNFWFTDDGAVPAIGKITPSGTITEYSTGLQANNLSCPTAITKGLDGNVWFTDQGSQCGSGLGENELGMITPSGTITEYATGLQAHNLSNPTSITLGPDGNLWFTDAGAQNLGSSEIGKLTAAGAITEYPLGAKSIPADIITGPDGNLWFTDQGSTRAIGRISTFGTITAFSIGLQTANTSTPVSLAVALDGNLWFTDDGATPEIGQITPSGSITENPVTVASGTSHPYAITAGSDDNLWMTDRGTEQIAKIVLGEPPVVGAPTVSNITTTSATITATIDPMGAPVSTITIQYGPDTNYGQTIQTTPSTLPPSGNPSTVTATLTNLPTASTIHYRIVATNTAGTATGPDYYITTQTPAGSTGTGGNSGNPQSQPPSITGVRQTHKTWRKRKAASRTPVGTTFSFVLNEPAAMSFDFLRVTQGRYSRGRCRPQSRSNRKMSTCVLTMRDAGQLDFNGQKGLNRVKFDGRLPRHPTLTPGSYRVNITAATEDFIVGPDQLRFTIVS